MHIIKATHEDDGEVVIIDCYYDTKNENEKLVYYNADGEIKTATRSKFIVKEKAI